MKKMQKNEGFTLIELLIVVAIIGIIAAIAVPGLMRARMSGNEASAIGSLRTINSSQATYASSCGGGGYAEDMNDAGDAADRAAARRSSRRTCSRRTRTTRTCRRAATASRWRTRRLGDGAGRRGRHLQRGGGLAHRVLRDGGSDDRRHHGHALLRHRPQRHDSPGRRRDPIAAITDGTPAAVRRDDSTVSPRGRPSSGAPSRLHVLRVARARVLPLPWTPGLVDSRAGRPVGCDCDTYGEAQPTPDPRSWRPWPWRPPWPPSTCTTGSSPIPPTPASATSARRSAARRCTGAPTARVFGRAGGRRRRHLVGVRLDAGRLRDARAAQRDGGPRGRLRLPVVGGRAGGGLLLRLRVVLRAGEDVPAVRGRSTWPSSASSSSRARRRPSGLAVLKDAGQRPQRRCWPARRRSASAARGWWRSLALVGLFPREPIGDATAPAHAAAAAPVETLDPAALTEWHKWLDAQPTATGGAARRRREGAGREVQRLSVPGVPHDLHGVSRHHRQVPGLAPRRVPVRDPGLPARERMRVRGHPRFGMRGRGRRAAGAREEQGRRSSRPGSSNVRSR